MLYIVEVIVDGGNLSRQLAQMQAWLDHMYFETAGFRQVPGTNSCRVDFSDELEARAFAQAFSGELLSRTAA